MQNGKTSQMGGKHGGTDSKDALRHRDIERENASLLFNSIRRLCENVNGKKLLSLPAKSICKQASGTGAKGLRFERIKTGQRKQINER